MSKIIIVEDEIKIRDELSLFLNKNGYETIALSDFNNSVNDIINLKGDLVLLDINIPKFDGQYVLKELRKVANMAIIMVTSRNSELDELLSLNYGADDFITKPYNLQLLLAHIEVVLRRYQKYDHVETIAYKNMVLNISLGLIECEDKRIELTKNEFKILYYLLKHQNVIVTREEIMSYLWDSEMFVDENTLSVNMNRLRKKLDEVHLGEIIETKRGMGYIINEF